MWDQHYNPLGNAALSTIAAAVPVVTLLVLIASGKVGVMGKMIDAQSIVVASPATNWYAHEGTIPRYVFLHSIVLACLVGVLVTPQAYDYPFTAMVLK